MRTLTDSKIVSKAKVSIPLNTIEDRELITFEREYQNCELIVENSVSLRIPWYTFLKTSLSQVNSLNLRHGIIRWQELSMNLAEFRNLTSLTIHKVDLRRHINEHPTPNLSKLMHLEVTFGWNPICFLREL